jgi:hypothetical protein
LGELIEASASCSIWADSPHVYSQHRRKEGRDIFFLCNTASSPATTDVFLRGMDSLERWDVDSGEMQPVPMTDIEPTKCFRLFLEAHESALFVSGGEGARAVELPHHIFGEAEGETLVCIDRWEATPVRDNVLILDKWNTRTDDSGVGVARRWFDDFSVSDFGPLVTPEPAEKNCPSRFLGDQPADFLVWYANGFYVTEGVANCRLVWETECIHGDCDLWVNGTKIEDFHRERVYDAFNLVADVQPLIRFNATNSIVVRVRIRRRNDGLLEPLRVFGRFSVNLDAVQLDAPITSLRSGSWTDQGLPHYAHDVAYESDFHLDSVGRPLFLDLGEVRDVAEVFVNGQSVGARAWRPFRFDIGNHVQVGENRLRVVVTGNSANLIYGARRASGLMQPVRLLQADVPSDNADTRERSNRA